MLDFVEEHTAILLESGGIESVNRLWSEFAERNGGRPETTGVGANYLEVCRTSAGRGDTTAQRAYEGIRDVLEDRRPRFEIEYPCHSPQTQRWFKMVIRPFEQSGHLKYFISHRNITGRVFTDAFKCLGAGFALWDSDDRLVLCNEAARSMPGVGEFLLPGREFEAVMRAVAEKGLQPMALGRQDEWIHERLLHHRDPRPGNPLETKLSDGRWIEAIEFRAPTEETLTFLLDVTERKRTEQLLGNAQHMVALGELAGGIAHDFNNLLTVMIGNVARLESATVGIQPAAEQLALLRNAVERGASMTDRLLAYSGHQDVRPAQVDVRQLTYELSDVLQQTLGERIELKVKSAPDLWPALVDAHQLEDALVNLIINAGDAMTEGGEILIEATNVTRQLSSVGPNEDIGPGDYVKVAVRDHGIGMSAEARERAFEPFFTTKPAGAGTGLGLSMVRGFAVRARGAVTIDSELGLGTTVTLYLPRAEQAAEPPSDLEGDQELLGKAERVLIVDDDPMVREISAELMGSRNYDVAEAASGEEALDKLKSGEQFDLLFVDVVLSDRLSGFDLAREARTLIPDIKVLYTTGHGEQALTKSTDLDDAPHLIKKPYRQRELLTQVRRVLDGSN